MLDRAGGFCDIAAWPAESTDFLAIPRDWRCYEARKTALDSITILSAGPDDGKFTPVGTITLDESPLITGWGGFNQCLVAGGASSGRFTELVFL